MRTISILLLTIMSMGCARSSKDMDVTLDEIEKVTREFYLLADTKTKITPSEYSNLTDRQQALYADFSALLDKGIRLTTKQIRRWEEIDTLNKGMMRASYGSDSQIITMDHDNIGAQ